MVLGAGDALRVADALAVADLLGVGSGCTLAGSRKSAGVGFPDVLVRVRVPELKVSRRGGPAVLRQ